VVSAAAAWHRAIVADASPLRGQVTVELPGRLTAAGQPDQLVDDRRMLPRRVLG
jgi:hypothetical protein